MPLPFKLRIQGATAMSNTMVNNKGDAKHPCANPFRNFAGRVAGVPGAATRADRSIIIRTSALAKLVGILALVTVDHQLFHNELLICDRNVCLADAQWSLPLMRCIQPS